MFCPAIRGGVLQRNIFQRPSHSIRISTLRQYATIKPAKVPGVSVSIPKQSPKPASGGFTAPSARRMPTSQDLSRLERLRKIDLVEKLYDAGLQKLYSAPPRLTMFRFQSYLVAAIITAMVLTYQKFNLLDPEEFKRRNLPRILYPTYILIATVLSAIGGICIYRTRGWVHAITLVKQHDQVFLKVTERSVIPFKKTSFLARPYKLSLYSRFVEASGLPGDNSRLSAERTSVATSLFTIVGRFFSQLWSATRLLVSNDGAMTIEINEEEAMESKTALGFSLDVTGSFEVQTARDGRKDPVLWELASLKDDASEVRSPFALFRRR